jgi:peptidoglycan/xylan/chitin deacetylase (PgdA/CDA1 family)
MAPAAIGPTRGRDLLVLCYHAVSSNWPELVAIEPAKLQAQVERLLRRGWTPTTFTEAMVAPPGRKTLAVTFDDAFLSTVRLAAPVLDRLGVPATIFVPTAFPDSGRPLSWPHLDRWLNTPYEPELESASWAGLTSLREAGWEIGSHTVSHPRLTELGAADLDSELRDSKAEIERHVGERCRSIAYPYGDVDDRVARAAQACGYEAGAALLPGRHSHDRLRFPRVFIPSREPDVLHRLHLRRTVRRLQSRAIWPGAQGS